MSELIKSIAVPANVRKEATMCPHTVNIYNDKVESIGGQGRTWFFKDYMGIGIAASVFCAYAGVRFLASTNAGSLPVNGTAMLSDTNRVNFCSGAFSYKTANAFTQELYVDIKNTFEKYKTSPIETTTANIIQQTSAADEIKKYKELLDTGIISQDEFDAKKKQLLGL